MGAPYPVNAISISADGSIADGYQPAASLAIIDTSQVCFADEELAIAELCDAVVLRTEEPEIRISGPEADVFRLQRDGHLDRTYSGRQAGEHSV